MQRLFVGIGLPPAVQFELAETYFHGLDGVKWTPPEQLHLTLAFLGEVDADIENLIIDCLGTIERPSIDLRLGDPEILSFGNRPGVIYLPVESSGLGRLKKDIDSIIKTEVEPELRHLDKDYRRSDKKRLNELRHLEKKNSAGRKFMPHITLARLPKNGSVSLSEVIRYTNTYSGRQWPVVSIDYFSLYSSVLTPKRAFHTAEYDFPLGRSDANRRAG